jgi:hypothetical protein
VTTTRTRSRDRRDSRSSAAREGAERRPAILVSAGIVIVLLAFGLAVTSAGHVVLAASDHFLLKYSGVFALLALTGSVCMGVVAADRIVMTPGHRVLAQAVHRAVSFGALAFLVIHIVLEITAPHLEESPTAHVHILDAFIPFLSQYRTFYMAEGTIASDIIVLLVVTGIIRRRFTAGGHAWKWRAIHYSSYAALILGVLHGLLAGRKAIGSFVYWSYGIVIVLVALAVLVRILAASKRSRDAVMSASPQSDLSRAGGQSMPARAAALGLMGQLTGTMPLAGGNQAIVGGRPGLGAGALTGPMPAANPFPPLDPFPPVTASAPRAIDGPPRYLGAPQPDRPGSGTQPPYGTGPQPVYATGPQPVYATGPQPVYRTGPQPAYGAGSQPAGPPPRSGTGPMPRSGTGPMPQAGTGPMPRVATGPIPQIGAGPMPPPGTGPMPRTGTGPMPRTGTGPIPRPGTGPMPRSATGPMPRVATGPQPVYPEQAPGYRPGPPAGSPPGYGQSPYGPDLNGRAPRGQDPREAAYGSDPREAAYGLDPRETNHRADPRYQQPDPGYASGYGPGPSSRPYETSAPYGASAPYGTSAPYGWEPYRNEPYHDEPYRNESYPGEPYGDEPYAPRPRGDYGPDRNYDPDQGYAPDQGYRPDQGYAPDGYGPDGYGAPPPPPAPPAPARPRPQPGRRRRPGGATVHERTGPLPQVPSYGGDERR